MGELRRFIGVLEREIVGPIITLVALAAFLVFIWGIVDFIWHGGDPEKRTLGQQHMFWGLLGLAILFSANALIALIATTVGR